MTIRDLITIADRDGDIETLTVYDADGNALERAIVSYREVSGRREYHINLLFATDGRTEVTT